MMRFVSVCVLFLMSGFSVLALEIETSSSFSNLYFDSLRNPDVSGKTFKGSDLFWCIDFTAREEFQEGFKVSGGFQTDLIQKRRLFSQINVDVGNFSLFFSPFIGFINTTEKWFNPGIEASLQYAFPGFGFLKGGFSTTFSPLSKNGDYYTGSQFTTLGVFLENGIVSLNIENKLFTQKKDQSLDATDELTKYYLNTEVFIKNFPFKFNVGTGYQILNRSYNSASNQQQTTLHSLLVGAGCNWEMDKQTVTYLQIQSAVATLGWNDAIYSVPDTGILYFVKLGVKYKF